MGFPYYTYSIYTPKPILVIKALYCGEKDASRRHCEDASEVCCTVGMILKYHVALYVGLGCGLGLYGCADTVGWKMDRRWVYASW